MAAVNVHLQLDSLSSKDFLRLDPRPTAIFEKSIIIHTNPAFDRLKERRKLESQNAAKEFEELLEWATTSNASNGDFADHTWIVASFGGTQKMLSGIKRENNSSTRDEREGTNISPLVAPQIERGEGASQRSRIDWTCGPVPLMSDYVIFLRNFDWASTPFGPIETWSLRLRQVLVSIIANPDPRVIVWGNDQAMIYNEACVPLFAQKHPSIMGQRAPEAWAEVWNHMGPIVDLAIDHGQSTKLQQTPLLMYRAGYFEETYWNLTMQAILGEDGTAVGALDEFSECTDLVIAERRMSTIVKLGERLAQAEDLDEVWSHITQTLAENTQDITFALLYVVDEENTERDQVSVTDLSNVGSSTSSRSCTLKGTVGFDGNHPAAIPSFIFQDGNEGYAATFRKVIATSGPTLIDGQEPHLSQLFNNAIPGRSGGAICRKGVICSIPALSGSTGQVGFLMLGLSAQRPYDDGYHQFVQLLNDRIVTSVTSISLPREQRQARAAAEESAMRHAALSSQLLLRTQEVERSEAKFTRMAHHAPVGMYLFKPDGIPIYFNNAYYKLTGLTEKDAMSSESSLWKHSILAEDVAIVDRMWNKILRERRPVTFEYRLKKPWTAFDEVSGHEVTSFTWLLDSGFPELGEDGSVKSVMGWITDISLQKWTETLQNRRLEDALELRRQRENFIDMTSHEMRNPLSAIIQSADGILSILRQDSPSNLEGQKPTAFAADSTISMVDSAETIVLCAQHQKRIVDDILTVSKLDANLLLIDPHRMNPISLLQKAIRMHQSELRNSDIDVRLKVDTSFEEKGITDVLIDSSRVLQVLINLLTNAIKFTAGQELRRITVLLGAAYDRPSLDPKGIKYIPMRAARSAINIRNDLEPNREFFLQIAVKDTGRGLTPGEINLLFNRFTQASAKTYQNYGGSGLGLFISRELAELQGGQIGVSSIAGRGSTFTFYIKALQCLDEVSPPLQQPSKEFKLAKAELSGPIFESSHKRKRDLASLKSSTNLQDDILAGDKDQSSFLEIPDAQDRQLSDEAHVLHVLIVEDNLINQKVLAQQLRRLGCVVYLAAHGLEALSFLEKTTFFAGRSHPQSLDGPGPLDHCQDRSNNADAAYTNDRDRPVNLSIILMDLEMPVMDGRTCITQIREMERKGELISHVPVIAITANARSEQVATALEYGMDDVITKPFRIPDLLPQMRTLVNKHKVAI